MTETVTVRRDDLRLLMDCAGRDQLPSEAAVPLTEALARCGEAMDAPAETEPPLPDGQFGRIELPGYRQHTGWITEETRFGVQMAVVRDWDGREVAAAVIGPNSQVVYLPTPLKRPEPQAALTAGTSSRDYWDGDDEDRDPF